MKRFLVAFVCLLGFFTSATIFEQNQAHDEKPEITNSISIDDVI